MKYIVVDIDGTMTMPGSDRLKYIQGKVKDWETYYSKCGEDEPSIHIVALVKAMMKDYKIVYCTGRRDKERQLTLDWLSKYTGQDPKDIILLMRDNGDFRKDHVVKPQMLVFNKIYPENTLFVLDDRKSVVDALRERNFKVLQVAEGNF